MPKPDDGTCLSCHSRPTDLLICDPCIESRNDAYRQARRAFRADYPTLSSDLRASLANLLPPDWGRSPDPDPAAWIRRRVAEMPDAELMHRGRISYANLARVRDVLPYVDLRAATVEHALQVAMTALAWIAGPDPHIDPKTTAWDTLGHISDVLAPLHSPDRPD